MSGKVKLALFSHLLSSRYFPRWRNLVAKVQGTRENSHTNFAFAFKLSNYCVNFSFKSVRASLICLGKSGCREIFSSWPQLVEKNCYLSISTHSHRVYTDQPHLSGLNEFKIFMRFLLPSNQERMKEWTSLKNRSINALLLLKTLEARAL